MTLYTRTTVLKWVIEHFNKRDLPSEANVRLQFFPKKKWLREYIG